MKALVISILVLIAAVFPVTAVITHLWTVIIAFTEGGFISLIVSLFLPVVSEIYWMFKMFGENDLYAWIALIHLILAIPVTLMTNEN